MEFEVIGSFDSHLVVQVDLFSLAWRLHKVLRVLFGQTRCFPIFFRLEGFALHNAEVRHNLRWCSKVLSVILHYSFFLSGPLRVSLQQSQDVKVRLLKMDVLLLQIV